MPRSGSTFVGNLFMNSNEFVYLFESTRGLADLHLRDKCATEPGDREANIIKSAFNCNFWPMRGYMDELHKNTSDFDMSWWWVEKRSSPMPMLKRCLPGDPEALPDDKRAHQSVAIKEITMWGPKIKWLYDTLGSDLRIIWLVRDVRGWVSSWLPVKGAAKHNQNFYESWKMNTFDLWDRYESCRGLQEITPSLLSTSHLENLKSFMENTSEPAHQRMASWWTVENALLSYYLSQIPKENYMLIQYEHVSRYPVEVTQQIYDFLGRTVVPKDIMQWIFKNTESKEEGKGDGDRYGTNRDSQKMATVWRERLTPEQLREVEEIGAPLFKFFNYEPDN